MSDVLRLRLIFSVSMSLLMSFLMTIWVTWLNIGFHPAFFSRWRHAFIAAWPVAFVVVIICAPFVQSFSQRLLRRLSRR